MFKVKRFDRISENGVVTNRSCLIVSNAESIDKAIQFIKNRYEMNKDNLYWNEIYMINRSWVYRHFSDGRVYETTYTVEN